MCGIAGVARADGSPVELETLERMARLMFHRGPDSGGFHQSPGVGLAHRRLAIIDPEGGQQPMATPDGELVIAYNGEVYNYPELRAQLEARGHRFQTQTDTEVVLLAYREWGLDALRLLNGMFAFAIVDVAKREVLLARDRLGIKPLYFQQIGGDLVFASEVKAMSPAAPAARPRAATLLEFLTFQNVLSDQTFFADVQKLPPAGWLRWRPQGVTQGRFWELEFSHGGSQPTFAEAAEEYADVLQRAVRRHMIADVPVGAYLSGGFDSASVATLARDEVGSEPFHTFTGAFTDAPYYDERSGSRAVAQRIGARTHEVEIRPFDFADEIRRVIYHLDEPTLGTGALPQYVVARLVSQHVKVVLTGHGGDECFAGYQVNKVALLQETWRRSRARLPRVLGGIRPDEWTRVLYFLLYPLVFPEVSAGLFIMTPRRKRAAFLTPEFLASCGDHEPLDVLESARHVPGELPGQRLMRLYLRTYLPTLFIQEDKLGMAHAVESRTPLCDNELVDFAARLPLSLKLEGGQLKALPRAAMRSRLPDRLYDLPKRGFPTPFQRWYKAEPLRSLLEDLLLAPRARQRGIVEPAALERLWRRHQSSKTDTLYDYARANTLYSCAMIELWHRIFIDGERPTPATPPPAVA